MPSDKDPTVDFGNISKETLETISTAIAKASATTGFNASTGAGGVDLIDLVSLVPVDAPFRDMLPRTGANQGSLTAQWRAILNINNQQPSPFVGPDQAGGVIKTLIQNVSSPYKPLAEGYSVTEDAIAYWQGFADAKAVEIFLALNQWKIQEDKALIGGLAFALGRPAAPTLTTATTGGSLGTSAVYIGVAARSGAGYFWTAGNSQGNSASTTPASGTTNAVTATIASIPGAVAYDWFYSANGTTWYYASTTTVPTFTLKATIAANATVPALPDLTPTVPTFAPGADNGSYDSTKQFNGLLGTLAGDYTDGGPLVSRGSGIGSGAIWLDNAGGTLTVSGGGIAQLDSLNKQLYDTARLSPSAYMISSQEANSISNLVLNSPGAVTYLTMNDAQGRSEVVAGGTVATYLNRAKPGAKIALEVHPHLPPGTIIARTDSVPFPGSNITHTLEVRTQREVYDYVYGSDRASGGPRQDGESRSVETLVNFAPAAMGVIQGVAAS